jgi:dTDP-4-amino-4,6-dideoxygalactose transaminase
MDGIQGAVLSVKLRYIDGWNTARGLIAGQYSKSLEGLEDIACPSASPSDRHVYHIYAVRVPDRESFMEALARKGVASAIHYPVPIHLQEAYDFMQIQPGAFPIAEQWAQEEVSLPMYPELQMRQMARVIDAVSKSCAGAGKIYFENEKNSLQAIGQR